MIAMSHRYGQFAKCKKIEKIFKLETIFEVKLVVYFWGGGLLGVSTLPRDLTYAPGLVYGLFFFAYYI